MPLDPFLEPLLAALPPTPLHIDNFAAYRSEGNAGADAMADQLCEPGPDVRSKSTVTIPVQGGSIALDIFHPHSDGPHPAHIYIHGGGFIAGSIHTKVIDIICRERAVEADCVVVAVEYRKAPEHPFPTGLNDCYEALQWVGAHAEELGVRPDLITVGGGSAGANLAAALTLKVRNEGGPAIAFQLLEVPALDFTFSSPSQETFGTGYDLTRDVLHMVRSHYLTSSDQATEPYVSPLLAPDLAGLPPAHIMSAEFDPLRDDGERYAARLLQAGVPATSSLQPGHIHSSAAFTKVMQSARAWRKEVLDTLNRVHAQTLTP
ncbi:alpha/beta hydrolase [Arthrobacter sp. NtRootA1]|uniref:alpha/beta hydrolase n=1 Tax=Arthrobacter sp. NtRootA1 TaxID=2830983 RepID=UPI001CC816DF|nr:alpha/beta hydrolase [Arthrobacter sp. NtRootA1]BCW05691.1 acetylhydrolase [Arthrobacter sp. NtRootA1]